MTANSASCNLVQPPNQFEVGLKPMCRNCNIKLRNMKAYVNHYRTHRHDRNVIFPCCIANCLQTFHTYKGLTTHLSRKHRPSESSFSHAKYQNSGIPVHCLLEFCQKSCTDIQEFMRHLREHIDNGLKISCPFGNCNKQFDKKSSFSSHVSRYHQSYRIEHLKFGHTNQLDVGSFDSVEVNDIHHEDVNIMQCSEDGDGNDGSQSNESIVADYTKTLALFLLRLQAKYLLPESTVQVIVDEMHLLNQIGYESAEKCFKEKLTVAGLSSSTIDELANEVLFENTVKLSCSLAPRADAAKFNSSDCSVLCSSYKRKKFFKTEFSYVSPVEIPLGETSRGKTKYCHYIPILQTLKLLCQDKSAKRYMNLGCATAENEYHDIQSGKVFKKNNFFKLFPNGLQIILFQDAFEVCNPLASAKTKHKVLAVYYTLGNLSPCCRSQIDPIQLVLLCKEKFIKDAGQAQVFANLVSDIQTLEREGILLDSGEILRGTVVSIVGDNLGSHYIGGFCENFNTEYFCRYCMKTKTEMRTTNCYTEGKYRTPHTYKSSLQALEGSGDLHKEGIKFDSFFNNLSYFHVALPGLPPCLGHDLFEGVVDYDMSLFIEYFVNIKKWFTYDLLNEKIRMFKFTGNDSEGMLTRVTKGKRIGGQAVQNWSLLRFFPLLVYNLIEDISDSVWQLFLKLKKLVEIVVSPHIDASHVACLRVLVEEYLEDRAFLFPEVDLRPKHHFLSHYHWLVLMFGPLIRLWTLRFESKHSFFKRCTRYSQNFINITSTLAEKHQLLQSYNFQSQIFPDPVKVESSCRFHVDVYSPFIRNAVTAADLEASACNVSDSVSVYGTCYKKGLFVIISAANSLKWTFASILLVLIADEEIWFIVNQHTVTPAPEYGIYTVGDAIDSLAKCVPYRSLLDYHPLSSYRIDGMSLITLKNLPYIRQTIED